VTAVYDTIGRGYTGQRRADPRLAAAIRAALGDARSVVNVGAGSGSYEPAELAVLAIEPSGEMIRQRPAGAAPAVQAVAERLPLADGRVDAALAVLTLHHWTDRAAGLAELKRVARRRVVIVTWDPAWKNDFWLTRDYFPGVLEHDVVNFPTLASSRACSVACAWRRCPSPTIAPTASSARTGAGRTRISTPACAAPSPPSRGSSRGRWRRASRASPTTWPPAAGTRAWATCARSATPTLGYRLVVWERGPAREAAR
jgi:SAM-dependent methyltransferase